MTKIRQQWFNALARKNAWNRLNFKSGTEGQINGGNCKVAAILLDNPPIKNLLELDDIHLPFARGDGIKTDHIALWTPARV